MNKIYFSFKFYYAFVDVKKRNNLKILYSKKKIIYSLNTSSLISLSVEIIYF